MVFLEVLFLLGMLGLAIAFLMSVGSILLIGLLLVLEVVLAVFVPLRLYALGMESLAVFAIGLQILVVFPLVFYRFWKKRQIRNWG